MTIRPVPAFDVRNPAQAVEALPYLLGFQPDHEGMVFVLTYDTLNDRPLFSQKLTLPRNVEDPTETAHDLLHTTMHRLEEFSTGPTSILLYLCADEEGARDGHNAMRQHRGLADALILSAEIHGVDILGVTFVTPTHWWAYHDRNPHYRSEGMPVDGPDNPGPVTVNALAMGVPTPPSGAKIAAAFKPVTGTDADTHRAAIREAVRLRAERVQSSSFDAETERLTAILDRLLLNGGDGTPLTDLTPEQTAELIVGLRHRPLRDVALGYIAPNELARARELWAMLARRCTSDSTTFVAPPLTLAGFAAAVAGEIPAALIATERARNADPRYLMAELLMEHIMMTGSVKDLADAVREEHENRLRGRDN
ncbi:DUF4192 domain-containing protein [Kitasatospora sp. NBC_01300]|uniref:DUF4192 domain-containing protein n=1 Tax=Kitasatospora sp. NBC_01300 TaxID=2903574 RepID=UPI00352DF342|nr:DUF4192 domain-containing protein [Kitasatospora sp. NBC_01300]